MFTLGGWHRSPRRAALFLCLSARVGPPPHLSWIRRTTNPTPTPLLPADESMSAEICVTSRLSHCHTAPNHKLMTGSQHPTHPQWVDLFLNRLSFFHDRVWSTAWLNHVPHLTQNHDVYLIKNWLRWGSAWPENNSSFYFGPIYKLTQLLILLITTQPIPISYLKALAQFSDSCSHLLWHKLCFLDVSVTVSLDQGSYFLW